MATDEKARCQALPAPSRIDYDVYTSVKLLFLTVNSLLRPGTGGFLLNSKIQSQKNPPTPPLGLGANCERIRVCIRVYTYQGINNDLSALGLLALGVILIIDRTTEPSMVVPSPLNQKHLNSRGELGI